MARQTNLNKTFPQSKHTPARTFSVPENVSQTKYDNEPDNDAHSEQESCVIGFKQENKVKTEIKNEDVHDEIDSYENTSFNENYRQSLESGHDSQSVESSHTGTGLF